MNIPKILEHFEYSANEKRTIKRCLRNLSHMHRRQLYDIFIENREIAKPFFDSLLTSAHAYNEETPKSGTELANTYQNLLIKLAHG